MPYIDQASKDVLEHDAHGPNTVGELNYCITKLLLQYVKTQGGASYTTFNAIVGALECAKLEFYRRMVVPYEETKCKENGDVY